MISVVLCKVSQPSLQKRKSYDENFVTAKSARINYGATLIKKAKIGPITVFDAILTSGQTSEKLQCLYGNLMSNNFRKTAVLKKI